MSSARSCPICQSAAKDALLFQKENIDESRLSTFSYASRKEPEYMCHRLLRCQVCDLVYASLLPTQDTLAQAYHVADYDSSEEANDAAQAYIQAMQTLLKNLTVKNSVLEIGAGTGALLERLKEQGFTELLGIEPSAAAIAAAPTHRRAWLREGIFEEKHFQPASFDLICCFMTLEHVHDPMITALAVNRLLRPGGALVTVTHNYRSLVNRLLGKHSPIIDIEHMQLFSNTSIYELFKRCGFDNVSAKPFVNHYSLAYWLRLAPLPKLAKHSLHWLSTRAGIPKFKLGLNVGNTMTTGFRRETA